MDGERLSSVPASSFTCQRNNVKDIEKSVLLLGEKPCDIGVSNLLKTFRNPVMLEGELLGRNADAFCFFISRRTRG